MAYVHTILDQNECLRETLKWTEVSQCVHSLTLLDEADSSNTGVTLYGPRKDIFMTISYCPTFGFYVSAYFEDSLDEYVLSDPRLGESKIYVSIGNQGAEQKRCVLVAEDLALKAAHAYFETGTRADRLKWLVAGESV